MDPNRLPLEPHAESPPPEPPRDLRTVRRRTLGTCAHCDRPVHPDEEYVRLHRRAWHLECALSPRAVSGVR